MSVETKHAVCSTAGYFICTNPLFVPLLHNVEIQRALVLNFPIHEDHVNDSKSQRTEMNVDSGLTEDLCSENKYFWSISPVSIKT